MKVGRVSVNLRERWLLAMMEERRDDLAKRMAHSGSVDTQRAKFLVSGKGRKIAPGSKVMREPVKTSKQ